MPELISLYETHAADRDRFEILAIHDGTVQSFAELDKKLAPLKHEYWQDKDLPFPILLDAKRETIKRYGIHYFPTGLLIDPSGNLVGEAAPRDLEAKLPPLPVGQRWARERDVFMNIYWRFEPTPSNTLNKLAIIFQRWSGCPVELDPAAVRAAGLKPDSVLPGVVVGGSITLRSIDDLMLAPHGLGLAASADGKKLRITRRPTGTEPASYFQKLHAHELDDRLDHAPATPPDGKAARAVEIRNQPLLDALKRFGHDFDLPVALDARAVQSGRLDPKATVSGRFDPARLRTSLTAMLRPLGLKIEVHDEVILVTAAPGKPSLHRP